MNIDLIGGPLLYTVVQNIYTINLQINIEFFSMGCGSILGLQTSRRQRLRKSS